MQKTIDEALVGVIEMNQTKDFFKNASLMLDFSRDVSNANEFVIAFKYFDEQNSKIITIILE